MRVGLNLHYSNVSSNVTHKNQNFGRIFELPKDTANLNKTKELSKEEKVNNFIKKLGKPVEEATNLELLETANMVEKRYPIKDRIVLSHYDQPDKGLKWTDLGVDENKFFEQVPLINGSANFKDSNVTNLGQLQVIKGDANFMGTSLKDLGNLRYVGGTIDCRFSKIEDLKNLEYVGRDAYFISSPIKDMGYLERVGGRTVLNGLKEYYQYECTSFAEKLVRSVSRLFK